MSFFGQGKWVGRLKNQADIGHSWTGLRHVLISQAVWQ